MVINFYECGSVLDKASVFLAVCSVFMACISGIFVHSNESDELDDRPIFREFLGGLDVFFTGRYLNETGKKWRIPYVVSMVYMVLFFLFPPCLPSGSS